MGKYASVALIFVLFFGCGKRPVPELSVDFQTRRPLAVAVLPVVYYPKNKLENWQDPVDVKSRFYQRLLFEEKDRKTNKVYLGLDKAVRESLQARGVSVVDAVSLEQEMQQMRFNGRLNWEELAAKLRVDSLIFVTLEEWSLSRFAQENRARVRLELALFNIQGEYLLWRDHNYPDSVSIRGKDLKAPVAALTAKAVSTTFDSFPLK